MIALNHFLIAENPIGSGQEKELKSMRSDKNYFSVDSVFEL